MRVQRIERLQRIIVIQGVSLVRILNHPSLDRLVGRDSKYPLTQSVGRENLSGCHLAPRGLRPLGARWHPSRFSLPLSFVCGYSWISPFLTLSFGEDLWILTRSPPSIIVISFGGAQYHCRPQIWEFSSVRHESLALLVNIAEYHSLGRWIEYRVQYHPSMRVLTWKSATACSKTWTLDLVGARATSYQLSHSNLTHHGTCRSGSYMKVCPRSVS